MEAVARRRVSRDPHDWPPVGRWTLRQLQAPLKERYRNEPDSAVVTLSAVGELDGTGVACRVQTARALVEAGLHPASGGDGTQLCSGDMLLELRAVAQWWGGGAETVGAIAQRSERLL